LLLADPGKSIKILYPKALIRLVRLITTWHIFCSNATKRSPRD
jgi:hypothetical protein